MLIFHVSCCVCPICVNISQANLLLKSESGGFPFLTLQMSFCKCDVHVFGVMRACWIFTLELFGHKVKLFHSTTKLFNPSAKLFCQTVSLSDLSSLPFHKQCINIPFAPQSHPHLTFLVFLILSIQFSSVQLLSRVRLFATP